VSQLYPRALGSLSIASYDSQGYGGGILSRLHTGNLSVPLDIPVYMASRKKTRKVAELAKEAIKGMMPLGTVRCHRDGSEAAAILLS
jgi:hypothetical protein